jgi:predicted hydrocarbon binding protein
MADPRLTAHGLEPVLGAFAVRPGSPRMAGQEPAVAMSTAALRSLYLVLERERAGTWTAVFTASGRAAGKAFGVALDRELARRSLPAAAALPLDACLAVLEHQFAEQGWGRLTFDLEDASHGIVVARLEHSVFVDALRGSGFTGFADALPAGYLGGFFAHTTGQALACEEIACAAAGAERCVFALAAPAQLAAIAGRIGSESVDAIRARLKQTPG